MSFTNHLVLIIRQFPHAAKDERQHRNSIISDTVIIPAIGRQQGLKHARQPPVKVQKIMEKTDRTYSSGGQPQWGRRTAVSFVDSVLQTLASLVVNKTGMEHRLEAHLATRVHNYLVQYYTYSKLVKAITKKLPHLKKLSFLQKNSHIFSIALVLMKFKS